MKKKLLLMFLSLTLIVTMMPLSIFASSNQGSNETGTDVYTIENQHWEGSSVKADTKILNNDSAEGIANVRTTVDMKYDGTKPQHLFLPKCDKGKEGILMSPKQRITTIVVSCQSNEDAVLAVGKPGAPTDFAKVFRYERSCNRSKSRFTSISRRQ